MCAFAGRCALDTWWWSNMMCLWTLVARNRPENHIWLFYDHYWCHLRSFCGPLGYWWPGVQAPIFGNEFRRPRGLDLIANLRPYHGFILSWWLRKSCLFFRGPRNLVCKTFLKFACAFEWHQKCGEKTAKKAFSSLSGPCWPLVTPWTPVETFSWLYLRCAFIFQFFSAEFESENRWLAVFNQQYGPKRLFWPFLPLLTLSGHLWPLEPLWWLFPGCICVVLSFFYFFCAYFELKPLN